MSRYLTNTENQLYKESVVSVKYWLSIGLYRLSIGLLRFLPFKRYLTNTNQYILKINI